MGYINGGVGTHCGLWGLEAHQNGVLLSKKGKGKRG